MNLLFPLAAVVALVGAGLQWRTKAARHIRIGAYYYDVTLRTDHYTGNRPDDTYFVVTGAGSRREQCAGTQRLVTRQGLVLAKGQYAISGTHLLFMEKLYNPQGIQGKGVPDSLVRTFSPNHAGQLRLVDYWVYRAGKGKRIRLLDSH